METTINLNERAKVTLTAKGAQIITEYYADMHKDYLMYMYGSSMFAGAEAVFVNNELKVNVHDTQLIEAVTEEDFTIEETERELIRRALTKAGGNRKKAAEILGLSDRTIYRKMKQYDL